MSRGRLPVTTLLIAMLFLSCTSPTGDSGSSTPPVNLSSAKEITGFSFTTPGAVGVIDTVNFTIAVTVPYGTADSVLQSLKPEITHTGASISPQPSAAQDFTKEVVYTVTAADGSSQQYTVKTTVPSVRLRRSPVLALA